MISMISMIARSHVVVFTLTLTCHLIVFTVGHCHPHVVGAGQEQMGKLTTSQGFLTETMSMYAKRLVETLPESLCVCFFLNSGYVLLYWYIFIFYFILELHATVKQENFQSFRHS